MLGSSTLGEAVIKTRLDTTGLKSGLQEAEKLASGFALGGSSKTGAGGNPYAKQLDEQRQQIRLLMNEYRVAGGNAQEFANKLRTLAQQNLTTAKNITDNAKASGQFATIAGTAASAADRLEGKINKLSFAYQLQQGIQGRVQTSLYAMGPAGSVAANGLSITSAAMGGLSIGATAGVAALAGLGIAYGKLEKRGTDLNRQIERDNVILRQSADNFEEIAQKIDSFGAGFEDIAAQYNKADITRGVTELVKAGREASETFDILEVATKVASIENENLNDVALGTSQVLRQFKLDVEDAGKAGDVLTRGSLEAQGSIAGLITGLSVVGPVAELAGLSLEETVAALVQLDQKGMDYADIGATALRSAISQLIDPSKEAKGVLDALGITATSGRDKFMQLTDAMASGEISAEQLAVIFDTRAVTAVANLDSNVFDLIGTMNEAGGELDTLANEMADTLEAAELRAKTAWDNVGTAISEGTRGMRTDMNEWSADVGNNVEIAIRKMNEWGAVFEKWRNKNLASGGAFGLFPELKMQLGPDGFMSPPGTLGISTDMTLEEFLAGGYYGFKGEATAANNPNSLGFSTTPMTLSQLQTALTGLKSQREGLTAGSPELADINKRIAAVEGQINAFYPTRNPTGGTGLEGKDKKTAKTEAERLLERIAGAETDYRNTIKNIDMLFPDSITQDEAWKYQLDETNSALKILLDNYSLLTDEQKLFVTQLQASKKELEGFVGESERLDDITKAFDKAGREGTLANKMALVKTASGELDPVTAELEAVDTRIKVLGNLIETLYELGASDAQIQNAVSRRDALISQYNARNVVPDFFGGANAASPIPVPNVSTSLTDRGQTALARSDYANRQALAAIFAQNPDFNGNFAGSRGSLTPSQLRDLLRVLNQVPVGQFMRGFDYGNNGEYQRDILSLGILPGGTGSIPGFTTNANRLENQRRGNIASYQMNQALNPDTSSTRYAAMKDAEFFNKYLRDQHLAGYEQALALGAFESPTDNGNVRQLAFNQAELARGAYERMMALGAFTTPMGVGGVSRVTQDAFLTPSYLQNIGGLGGLGGMSDEAIKGLIRNGVISSPFGATDQGVEVVRAAVEGFNESADKQKQASDEFYSQVVGAAGQVASVFTQIATGKATPGGIASGLGGAAAGIVGTFNPLAGQIVGVASGILGGIFDAFGQDDKKRKEEALRNQNRQLPTLNIDFAFNQYNQWTGQPSDPENVGALTQQNGEMVMLVEKVILPAIQQHSNKLGLSTP